MFDWNDLRYLLAVADTGSTIAAARALGVNQSTVHPDQRHTARVEAFFDFVLSETDALRPILTG